MEQKQMKIDRGKKGRGGGGEEKEREKGIECGAVSLLERETYEGEEEFEGERTVL